MLHSYLVNTCLKSLEHIFSRTLAVQLDFTPSRSTIETCEKRNLTTRTTTNKKNWKTYQLRQKEFATS